MWIALAACSPDGTGRVDDDPTTPSDHSATTTDEPPPTETGGPPAPAEVECAATPNPLVFRCAVTLPEAGPATVRFAAEGADERVFTDDAVATQHELVGWGLLPDTTYTVTVEGASTTVTTGSLPAELAGATFTVSGALTGIDAVLVYIPCGAFVMVDGQGRVIWHLRTEVYDSFTDAMRWSQDTRSVLAVTDSAMSRDDSEVLEVDVEWTERTHLVPGEFQLNLTHDADSWGGYTYLLGETSAGVGGFEVFDGPTRLGQWLLTDAFAAGEVGRSHVNGLTVSERGEVVISELTYDAVLAVDGDPASPTFLQLQWHAVGSPGGRDLPAPDVVPVAPPAWRGQHNASRVGDELWVFDNRSDGDARAVRMQLDLGAGTVTELDSWSTGLSCTNQGGALPVPGGVLTTCANNDRVALYRDGQTTPDWTMRATCNGRAGGSSTRAYPVIVE
jgi:hypothetical protein